MAAVEKTCPRAGVRTPAGHTSPLEGDQARGGGLSGGRSSRRGAPASIAGAAVSVICGRNAVMCSGSANAPATGSNANDESSTPLHHLGALVDAGRELVRLCIGHITP